MVCSKAAWQRASEQNLGEQVIQLRSRLCQHLQDSRLYKREEVLAALSGKDLFEEEAIVLEQAGISHTQRLPLCY